MDEQRELERLIEEGEQERRQGGALIRGWRLFPRAAHYLKPYKKSAVGSVVLTIVLAVAAIAEPWPLAFIIDTVLGDKPAPGWVTSLVGDGPGKFILLAVAGSLLITLTSGAIHMINEMVTTKLEGKMGLDFRSDLFQHVERLSFTYHDDTRAGILMYRLNTASWSVSHLVVNMPVIAQSVLTMLGMAWIAWRVDPLLAQVSFAVVPIMYYSTTYYANYIEPHVLQVRAMEGLSLMIVHEMIQMLKVIVAFGREGHEYGRFRAQGEAAVGARVGLTIRQTSFRLAVNFITAAGTAAVLGVGAFQVLNGKLTAGELLVMMSYVAAVYTPLEQLTSFLVGAQQQFIMFEHALQVLDTPVGVEEKPDAIELPPRVRGEIELRNVSFSYESRPGTLRDISVRIEPGEAVAIVGVTGAGKSTLVSLLPRFYDPEEGAVLIDGVDVRDVTLASLRNQFSIVLQEPLLFSGTIMENIRYGRIDATDEEVKEAAKAANAHDFIVRLPDKYKTELGERGGKISGGERQRIAVARAFLRNAPILILDEPTSSIDSKTEEVILEALERLMEGRTTIMIAHRLSTIRSVDKVLVIHNGQIAQEGTPRELRKTPGLYRRLWKAQTQGILPPGRAGAPAVAGAAKGGANGNGAGAAAGANGEAARAHGNGNGNGEGAARREAAAQERPLRAPARAAQATHPRPPAGPPERRAVMFDEPPSPILEPLHRRFARSAARRLREWWR